MKAVRIPAFLLLVCILSHGLLIFRLGVYWDDWPLLWAFHSMGNAGLREYAKFDRPFMGYLYDVTMPLLGEAPWRWHLFALIICWIIVLSVWWCLRGVWPTRRREVLAAALLFAVYPGFTLQPISVCFANDFIPLLLFIFSLGATVWALRATRFFWPLTIAAVVSSAISLILTEYYVGLQLLRPLLIWIVLGDLIEEKRERLRTTIKIWLPYIGVVVLFVIWRLLIFKGSGYFDQSIYLSNLTSRPFFEVASRLKGALADSVEAGLMAWTETFRPGIFDLGSGSVRLAWGLVILSGLGTGVCLWQLRSGTQKHRQDLSANRISWAKHAALVGLFAILAGGLPIWLVGRDAELNTLQNRYSLPMKLGACILLVGLVELIVRTRLQRVVVISVVIGLAIGFQFRNANSFRQDWLMQESLFWQLSWRAPALKPGTSIVIDQRLSPGIFDSQVADYTLASPLNIIYSSEHSTRVPYWFFNLSNKSARGVVLKQDAPLEGSTRVFPTFSGSMSKNLSVWFSSPSCLRVLDPGGDHLMQMPPLAQMAQGVSNLEQIDPNPSLAVQPPVQIFGPEPAPCWCYYFEKADLARQIKDWRQVASLGDEARQRGFTPADQTEWFPFIEGYVQVGRYEDAKEIVKTVRQGAQTDVTIEPALNSLWKRLSCTGQQDTRRMAFLADVTEHPDGSPVKHDGAN